MSGKTKHVPMRTCIICRQKLEKRRLTRFVSTSEGVFIDLTGKSAGRGAYVCDKPDCRQRALISNMLAKALRTSLTDADRQRIGDTVL
jgi:uncharacterized protein